MTLNEGNIKEQKLNEKIDNDLYKDLFFEALEGIVFWTGYGKIVKVNEAACRIFECEEDELLTKSIQDFVFLKDAKYDRIVDRLFQEGSIREELAFLMPNGQMKYLEFTSKLHSVENFHMTIFRNVTDRKQIEQELRESELKFRKVFEGALEGMIMWNGNEVVDINQAGEKMFNLPREKIIGRSLMELLTSFNIEEEELISHFENLNMNGYTNEMLQINTESGRRMYFEFSAKQNVFSKLSVILFKDVTDKKEMEEQLKKSDTLNVVGELAAGIAHEIRNPMTALKGFIQLLEDSIKEDHSMYFNIISTELKRIESIINEFLLLAKPQSLKFFEKDVTKIMQETVDFLKAQAVLHNVQIISEYEKELPLIYCEPNQLKKVFINLIKNAIEVMPNGGNITVSMEISQDHFIHISIKDEGIGIPKNMLEKLGQPFYTTKEKGTGLGLMVTYKIIEEHKGFIQVESESGVGTEFHIYLPFGSR
ncbi:two-component system, sporulation sensor kinase E [Cytobacillus eiseniae]|uniref:histidine kinase n=1 Tax=Cytobacillus eiseniae TaxID=762947 RepID=A0ABS4RB39_9BACI|nr:PAS domain-containing sensor histidine kinase [Cytobacillus eiseniae]MBP2239914.1 two-component system, sporulation sensor kinase E [Cytobacillus eiseniae]